MARLYPTLLVVPLLLAACASSGPSLSEGDPAYLQALSSDYSIRSDALEREDLAKLREELPESLIAGNEDLTVAAAMFHRNDHLTFDLIIHNHSGEPLSISRADMYVLDYMGTRLEPVDEWEGAENFGLRGRIRDDTEYVYLEGQDVVPGSYGQTQSGGGSGGKAGDSGGDMPLYDQGRELDMLTEPVEIRSFEVTAPEIMTVENGESRPYWAYFDSKDIVYPLSAVVRMEGKRLIFRFEAPEGRVAN